MIRRTSLPVLLGIVCFLALAVLAQPLTGEPAVAEILAANNAAFSAAYIAGDARTIVSLYTEDARLDPPGRVVEGREAIERYFTLAPNQKVLDHSLTTESLEIVGETAIETGTWTSTTRRGEGDPVTSSDRYLLVWRRQADGRWLIHRDWWHRPSQPVTSLDARPMRLDRTEVRVLKSKINDVDYELRVALPHGYGVSGKRFPVVYTLDADYSFLIVRNIVDHLSERGDLDEVIVVGIAYGGPLQYRLNRTRDYTPVFVSDGGYGREIQKVSGGGPEFIAVIEMEIIPLIDENYATLEGDRTLTGHSYGGLFTVWTMLTRPDLFRRTIAVSPSLWYDDHLMMRIEKQFAETHRSLPVRAYLCVGSRERNSERSMVAGLERFSERLRSRRYAGLALESHVLADETHNSVYPRGISNGLRFVFQSR